MIDLDHGMELCLEMWHFFNTSHLVRRRAAAKVLQAFLRRARERIESRRREDTQKAPMEESIPVDDAEAENRHTLPNRPKLKLEEARELDIQVSQEFQEVEGDTA